ncbi:MAG: APC family permease [Chloroflexota bacterium]
MKLTEDPFSPLAEERDEPHDLTRSPILPDVAKLDQAERRQLEESGRRWAATLQPLGPEEAMRADPSLREVVPGSRGHYVRVRRSAQFDGVGPGIRRATRLASEPTGATGRTLTVFKHALVGDPLSLQNYVHERLSKLKALAVLSSDAISSVAYATEAILLILLAAGTASFRLSLPIAAAIILLMLVVGASYRQTIMAYPKGGGSYIVARDNLGDVAGLTAAAALMTDYTLTVAVSVASGVSAVIAAYPALAAYRVPVGVLCILLIFLGNLRGIREAGTIFAIPTYAFILGMYALIIAGFWLIFTGRAPIATYQAVQVSEGVSVFLILRAFSNGCSAMTGVEAISDGVPAFRPTEWRNARTTLTWMIAILASIYAGVTLLAHLYQIMPDPTGNNPLLSRLNAAVFGANPIFYAIQYATFLILVLAANTAFSDFPRLLFFLARDDFAPRIFRRVGDRLAFSNGIITLAVLASVLYALLNGQPDALLPLYTIGVFSSFTLSQAGMVRRWYRRRQTGERDGVRWEAEPRWRRRAAMNGLGAVTTLLVLVIAAATKFTAGAWFVLVLIPCLIVVFLMVHHHYGRMEGDLRVEAPLAPDDIQHTVLCPISDLNRPALRALAYARSLSPHVIAVHISQDPEDVVRIQTKWKVWGQFVPLEIIESPYRGVVLPTIAYIDALRTKRPTDTITVILPEFVPAHWWEGVLHNQTALRLKRHLLYRPGVVVTNVPYHQQRKNLASSRLP